ncbi:hypothetical protein niasHT_031137 [Heterodera trifolii]|uniref:Uncharacterized protein n=1 Tax=Heterodera trifolii TaxID=157864 RepID=A0ABD2IRF1_9BILA
MPRKQVCVIGLVVLENGDEAKLAGKTLRIIARIAKNQRKKSRLTFVGRFSKVTRVTRSALLQENSWKIAYEVAKEVFEENYDDNFFDSTCIEVIAPLRELEEFAKKSKRWPNRARKQLVIGGE